MQKNIKQNAVFYLAAILIALALKQHYSQASAEALGWILKPIAGLVAYITGDEFIFKAGTGYICATQRVIIAPACAGVNFLLMAFGMPVFTGMHHMRKHRHRFLWLMCSLVASYGLTVFVNTLRIMVSIHTFHADIYDGGLTREWVHRMEGVVIYFFFLHLFYSMIGTVINTYAPNEPGRKLVMRMADSNRSIEIKRTVCIGLIPCVWYLAVTLAVPFLNNAPKKMGGQFYDHATMVLGLCLITWICITAILLCGHGVRLLFSGGGRKHEAPNSDR